MRLCVLITNLGDDEKVLNCMRSLLEARDRQHRCREQLCHSLASSQNRPHWMRLPVAFFLIQVKVVNVLGEFDAVELIKVHEDHLICQQGRAEVQQNR